MMLQMDYAENYSCRAQDEVQTAHWNQEQVTLYTSVTWFRDHICSHVIVSDSQSHNKSTVVPFTHKLLDEKPSDVTHVKIWTDGPPSQFKNQFAMASMNMSKKHNVKLSWNFSATSHGKGPVNGVGATLKRHAMEKVQTSKVTINNVNEFYQAVRDSNIKVTLINTTELQKYSNKYLETLFSNSTLIPGITGLHFIQPSESGYVTKRYSSEVVTLDVEEESDTENALDLDIEPNEIDTPSFQVKVGNWYTFPWRNISIGILDLF